MTIDGSNLDIPTLIKRGEADHDLDGVVDAVKFRKGVLANRLFDDLEEGDRVRIRDASGIKPGYLRGALATVKEKRISKITITFDPDINDPYGKWAGKGCVLSPSMVEKVED